MMLRVLFVCALVGVGNGHIVKQIIGDAKNTIKGISGIVTGGLFGVLGVHREEEMQPETEELPEIPPPEDYGPGWPHHLFHHHHHHHGGSYGRPQPDYQRHEQPIAPFEPSPPVNGHKPPGYQPGYKPETVSQHPGYDPVQGNQPQQGNRYPVYQSNQGSQKPVYQTGQGNNQPGNNPYQGNYKPSENPGWNQPGLVVGQQPGGQNLGNQPDLGNDQPGYIPAQGNQNPGYQPEHGYNQKPGYQPGQGSDTPIGGEQANIHYGQKPNIGKKPGQGNQDYDGNGIPEYAYRPENGESHGDSSAVNPFQNGVVGSTSRPIREEKPVEEEFELDIRSSFDDDRKT